MEFEELSNWFDFRTEKGSSQGIYKMANTDWGMAGSGRWVWDLKTLHKVMQELYEFQTLYRTYFIRWVWHLKTLHKLIQELYEFPTLYRTYNHLD